MENHIRRGNEARDRQEYEEAAKQYNEALRLDLRESRAHYGLGNVHADEAQKTRPDNPEKAKSQAALAIGSYRKALELNRNYAEAYYGLGYVYLRQQNPCDAIKQYEQAARINPNSATTLNALGVANTDMYRIKKSGKTVPSCSEQPDEYARKAMDYYRAAFAKDPGYYMAHFNLGDLYFDLGRYPEAAEQYRRVIAIKPDHSYSYFNLGFIYYTQGKYSEAIAPFKQRIKLSPDHADPYYYLGLIYLQLKNKSAAMEQYEKLRTINPVQADKLLQEINKSSGSQGSSISSNA